MKVKLFPFKWKIKQTNLEKFVEPLIDFYRWYHKFCMHVATLLKPLKRKGAGA